LPPGYKPLWVSSKNIHYLNALKYLKNRGIAGYDIIRYQMGYAMDGPYANRIIVPSYDANNKLNYFILGKFVPKKLLKTMIKHQVKDVYVALDEDALTEAREIENSLSNYGMNVKLVNLDKKDPSELGFKDTWECINQAERSTFKDYIGGRLQNI